MAYSSWSVVFGEQPSAAKWNILGTNDAHFADIVDPSTASAWSSWTPTWVNLTVGNATQTCKYKQIGKVVTARLSLVFGSTTSVTGTAPTFTLPITAVSYPNIANDLDSIGTAFILDSGTAAFPANVAIASTTTARVYPSTASGTYSANTDITSTVPMTWTTNDVLTCKLQYEAA